MLANENVNWSPNLAGFPISGVDLGNFGSTLSHTEGFAGGGQVGCDYQSGQFAWGVESDFGYAGINGTRSIVSPGVNAPSFSVSETLKSDFLATLRGRIGLVSGSAAAGGSMEPAGVQSLTSNSAIKPVFRSGKAAVALRLPIKQNSAGPWVLAPNGPLHRDGPSRRNIFM